MTCKLNKDLLLAFRDDTIDPLEKIFVEEHLRYCDKCQADLYDFVALEKKLHDYFSDLPVPLSLDYLAQMVAENLITSEYSFNAWDTFRGTLSVTKVVAKNVIRAGNMPRKDPYHQYIDRLFNQTIQFAKRPVRRIMKQRLDQLNPLKIFG